MQLFSFSLISRKQENAGCSACESPTVKLEHAELHNAQHHNYILGSNFVMGLSEDSLHRVESNGRSSRS